MGPLLLMMYLSFFTDDTSNTTLEMYLWYLGFGLFLSLPAFIVYFGVFSFIAKTIKNIITLKLVLNSVAITGLLVTFESIGGTFPIEHISIPYILAIMISSLFYKIKDKTIS